MRLIIPLEFYRHGGVEKVIVSLIREMTQKIDRIILIIPPHKIHYFQNLLPNSDVIVYESTSLNDKSKEAKILGFLNKLLSSSKYLKSKIISDLLGNYKNKYRCEARLNQLITKYQATHCLYVLTNNLAVPKLKIPLGMISHDMFWRFSLLSYTEIYRKKYDNSLLEWLNAVDIVFTVSEKTRQDILSLFPTFIDKIYTVPNASNFYINKGIIRENNLNYFYFPSSFGIYKDQLTLLKAGIKLAQKGLRFKIVLTGKETDSFIKGNLSLSQQSFTQEYKDYLQECQQVYQENKEIIEQYFLGLGYGSEELVENWYSQSACVVVPSQYEGFGLALSEAIVRGLPVICSDLEVFHEQVELYKCGDRVEFFTTGDVDSLVNAMERFLMNPKSKLAIAEIEQRFAHWTWKEAAEKYIKLFEKIENRI